MTFLARFRRAMSASLDTWGPQAYRAAGDPVTCPVCRGREFLRSSGGVYLKPALLRVHAPWLKLDRYATSLVCTHCANILTFGRAPEPDEEGESLP